MAYKEEIDGDALRRAIKKGVGLVVLLIVALIVIFGTFYTVGAGERGIVLTWGNPSMDAKLPGLHLKVPIAQSVVVMVVQTAKYETPAAAASKDLQVVSSHIAVNYHLTPETVPELYKNIGVGYEDKVIQPAVQEEVKAATAKYTAEELITQRPVVKQTIEDSLRERLVSRGIIVESVNIVNFDFSEQFNAAIESKVTAEQDALKAQRILERIKIEANQAVAAAEGQKNSKIAIAQGDAEAIKLIDEQLSRSPQYIQFLMANRWNGVLPTVTGGAVPFLNLNAPVQTTTVAATS